MKTTVTVMALALVTSLLGNLFQFRQLKRQKTKRQTSYSVTELIHDLTEGPAVVQISRIDPASVVLRVPRQ